MGTVGFASALGACQSTPKQEEVDPVVQQVQAPVELTAQQKVINSLLSGAHYCVSQNKLLNPIADNAHDRYRSVLKRDIDYLFQRTRAFKKKPIQ